MNTSDGTTVSLRLREGMAFDATGQEGFTVLLDSSPEHGGSSSGFSPMEMVLVGLGGCTAMDVLSILRKKRQTITAYEVAVTGRQRQEYPRVYTEISIRHLFTGVDVSPEAVRRAIELSDTKYCPVYAMLQPTATISSSFEIRPAPVDN